jgi:hypothetical protein
MLQWWQFFTEKAHLIPTQNVFPILSQDIQDGESSPPKESLRESTWLKPSPQSKRNRPSTDMSSLSLQQQTLQRNIKGEILD